MTDILDKLLKEALVREYTIDYDYMVKCIEKTNVTKEQAIEYLENANVIIIKDMPDEKDLSQIDEFEDDIFDEKEVLDDSLKIYFNEIGRYRLLSPEEELKYMIAYKENGDEEAKKLLINSNLRLVTKVAKKYVGHGLTYLDLIQEGNIGLIRSIEKFDYKKGYRLSTYATWWIMQSVNRAVSLQGRTIKIPVHLLDNIKNINKEKLKYKQLYNSEPTLQELSKMVGMKPEVVKNIMELSQEPLSLYASINDEDDSYMIDVLEDKTGISPERKTIDDMIKKFLSEALDNLSERDRRIIIRRFGLYGTAPMSLEKIGKEENVTKERVRQLQLRAIRELKKYFLAHKIEEFAQVNIE